MSGMIDVKRDRDVDQILQNASLPLLRVFARKAYDPELISRLLLEGEAWIFDAVALGAH